MKLNHGCQKYRHEFYAQIEYIILSSEEFFIRNRVQNNFKTGRYDRSKYHAYGFIA